MDFQEGRKRAELNAKHDDLYDDPIKVALADLVAAAEEILRAFNDERNPTDEEIKALDDATDDGRNALK